MTELLSFPTGGIDDRDTPSLCRAYATFLSRKSQWNAFFSQSRHSLRTNICFSHQCAHLAAERFLLRGVRVAYRANQSLHRGGWRSDQPLWYDVPVCSIEEVFLHVVILAGPGGMRWMFVVEHQLRGPVPDCRQETHHLSIIGCLAMFWLFPTHLGNQTPGQHPGLEVGSRTTLGHGQVGGITQGIDVALAFDC